MAQSFCGKRRWAFPVLGLLALAPLSSDASASCWSEGFSAEYCCRGQRGRDDCWDALHNFEKCCLEYKNTSYPFNDLLWGRRDAAAVDPRKYPPKGKIAAAHLRCLMEMQNTGTWQERHCSQFRELVDRAVEKGTPGSETRAQYLGTHYRILLRSLPYASFASPVFDAFYKARSFPLEFWGRDDFALFEAAFRALLGPGHTAVDGGANIGGYTQMMALAVGSSGEVHSFEPFRITFQFLNANVVLAGLQNVWTYNKALSNRNGAKTKAYGTDIQDPAQQMIWNSLVIPRDVHWEFGPQGMWLAEPSELEQLEHVTLDSLGLRRLDFIKSDVEGMEGHLFLGGLQTIQTFWPSILVEIKEFQRRPIHTFLVSELGYSCHSALTTNPSDFFCWHPRRAASQPGENRRIHAAVEVLTTELAFSYCEACRKRKPAPVEVNSPNPAAQPQQHPKSQAKPKAHSEPHPQAPQSQPLHSQPPQPQPQPPPQPRPQPQLEPQTQAPQEAETQTQAAVEAEIQAKTSVSSQATVETQMQEQAKAESTAQQGSNAQQPPEMSLSSVEAQQSDVLMHNRTESQSQGQYGLEHPSASVSATTTTGPITAMATKTSSTAGNATVATSTTSKTRITTASGLEAQTAGKPCTDDNIFCGDWAQQGECANNAGYMLAKCRVSCGVC